MAVFLCLWLGKKSSQEGDSRLWVIKSTMLARMFAEILTYTLEYKKGIGEICKLADGIDIYSSKTSKQVMEAYQIHMGEHCPFCVDMDMAFFHSLEEKILPPSEN